MFSTFLTSAALLASAHASVWPYHEPLGLVPATGAVIKGPSYGVAQGVAEAHASSAATNYVSPTYFKGHVSAHDAGETVIAGPSDGNVVIKGPSKGSVSIIGPSEGPVYISGPSAGSTTIVGPAARGAVISGPSIVSPSYARSDAEASAIARAHANANAYASPVPVSSPGVVRGYAGEGVIICPHRFSAVKPLPYALAAPPVAISGPSAGSAALAGPQAPATVIAGPSGTITTSGSSTWPANHWVPAWRKW